MDDTRDTHFCAWVQAERTAYDAVHRLHESTQGGRLPAPAEALAAVVALRRDANNRLAQLSHAMPPPVQRRVRPVSRAGDGSAGFAVPHRSPEAAQPRVGV